MTAQIESHSHGFHWGPMWVTRMASFKRGKGHAYVLGVNTDHHKVEVYVSNTGRSVRIHLDGKEVQA